MDGGYLEPRRSGIAKSVGRGQNVRRAFSSGGAAPDAMALERCIAIGILPPPKVGSRVGGGSLIDLVCDELKEQLGTKAHELSFQLLKLSILSRLRPAQL